MLRACNDAQTTKSNHKLKQEPHCASPCEGTPVDAPNTLQPWFLRRAIRLHDASHHCIVAAFLRPSPRNRGIDMKMMIAIAGVALTIASSAAVAQERAGDAALGALSGAVVLGPIGAVAGAVVGYTAGPSIARSWGLRRSKTARHGRQPVKQTSQRRPSPGNNQLSARNQAPAPIAAPPQPTPRAVPAPAPTMAAPPAQGFD